MIKPGAGLDGGAAFTMTFRKFRMTKPIQLALLIDDNEIDNRFHQISLKTSGLVEQVMTFNYADEALAHIKAHPEMEIDVIFLDINMPRMDGIEFLAAATKDLGESFAKVVVVMLTTSLPPVDSDRTMAFSVVKEFIDKPLTVEHVQHVAKLVADAG